MVRALLFFCLPRFGLLFFELFLFVLGKGGEMDGKEVETECYGFDKCKMVLLSFIFFPSTSALFAIRGLI